MTKNDDIFSTETLNEMPIFYRYMTKLITDDVAELKKTKRFSVCDRHFSNRYLNTGLLKPVGEIDIKRCFEDER